MESNRIKALADADWNALEGIFKRVAGHKGPFSTYPPSEKEDGVIMMASAIESEEVIELRRFLYDKNLIVQFDWARWDEGRKIFADNSENKFDNVNAEDILKLFTAVIRNDRFNEGAFANLLESGDALRLLRRLLEFKPSK